MSRCIPPCLEPALTIRMALVSQSDGVDGRETSSSYVGSWSNLRHSPDCASRSLPCRLEQSTDLRSRPRNEKYNLLRVNCTGTIEKWDGKYPDGVHNRIYLLDTSANNTEACALGLRKSPAIGVIRIPKVNIWSTRGFTRVAGRSPCQHLNRHRNRDNDGYTCLDHVKCNALLGACYLVELLYNNVGTVLHIVTEKKYTM